MQPLRSKTDCEVAVIGAGPYGLSVAAHLKAAKVDALALGRPMSFWREHMPKGMRLRSPWVASHFSDPDRAFSLDAYAARERALSAPVPLDDFVRYGEWFQSQAVPDLDTRKVIHVKYQHKTFHLRLADGDTIRAKRVVVAAGLENQDYRPEAFRGLPKELVSHTCDHDSLGDFRGRRVAVIGRGQSACESAALLHEAGADVELISRGDVNWLGTEAVGGRARNDLVWRLHKAMLSPSGVGPFPIGWLAEAPDLVRRLPAGLKAQFTARCLRPGAAAWVRSRFDGVRCNPGRTILAARAAGEGVALQLDNGVREFDHVLLATGYRIDIARMPFLSPKLIHKVHLRDGSPVLSAGCETTLHGLHFVGSSAVLSFGPLMRFVAGAGFAARSVTGAVLGRRRRSLFDWRRTPRRDIVPDAAESASRP
jgi:hypothetical protein